MKQWKLKALATAIAVVIAGPGHATISDSQSGNGELFFTIYDTVSQTSYTRDLGLTIDSFTTAAGGTTISLPASVTFAADSALSAFLGTFSPSQRDTLLWNIGAADAVGGHRYLTTAAAMPGASGSSAMPTNFNLRALGGSADQFISANNPLGTHTSAANGSNAANAIDNGIAFGGSSVWANNWGGKTNFADTQTGLGTSNNFWLLFTNPAGSVTSSLHRSLYAAAGTFSLESDGDLVLGTPAAVPVPAAVWLLGSGLMGLVGVARRRDSAKAA